MGNKRGTQGEDVEKPMSNLFLKLLTGESVGRLIPIEEQGGGLDSRVRYSYRLS